MKIEMNLTVPANNGVPAWLNWLRVYFKLWHPALMYTLFIWYLCGTVFDGPKILFSKVIDGYTVTIMESSRTWGSWDHFLLVVLGACIWSYTSATFPRWWKTIRRLNYNRVSRIG
uniref:Uncharacterized protein n=1 Tax=Pseudomonas phage HRDY3 TaxID=3236930 RepID=A0AB39CEI4_9VIRU